MVLQIGQVQGTRGCLLGQLAVFCWSGKIVSSSGSCHVLHIIAACAVDVGGELYQRPRRSQVELHLPDPPRPSFWRCCVL